MPVLVWAYTPPESNRTKYNFNPDWKFLKANPAGAENPAFDDSAWSTVSCPHTFNDIDAMDDYILGNHIGESNQWRGTVWYRKSFKLPAADADQKVFIEFESVRQIAQVFINGVQLGTNQTGFIPFGYDLTPYLNFGSTSNVIAVRVNNDRNDDFQNNTPLTWNHEHWHPVHGGIYRNVYLHTLDKVHVTLPLYDNLQTVGTYVYASNVSATSAQVTVQAEVQNENTTMQLVSFEAAIVDNDGVQVGGVTNSQSLAAGAKYKFSGNATLLNPHLWLTRHPYLYKVYSIVRVGGVVKDVCETPLGIRSFDFNKDTGFWLNGEHVKLHGWGQKPTEAWPGLGAAHPDWLKDFTYKLMDEGGGNFIRWGHCAGAPAEIAMGDKYGFVALMPGVCGESDNTGEGWTVRINAFRDMVVYYRNHPSIFIWEGGNWAISAEHFQEMTNIIHTFDPASKRLLGNRRAEVKATSINYVTIEVGTEGWDRTLPTLPIVESEYMRDESPRRVWDNLSPPNFGDYPRKSMNQYKWTSEEFAVKQADHWWNKMGKKEYHCGGANWIFSDGPHGGRNPSEVVRASGEVDAARLPKEAFYALKAMWRPEPQVHIVGHWNYPGGTTKDVFVMSNCRMVKLYVNGVLQGTNSTPENGYAFRFSGVNWAAGTVTAEGYIDDVLRVTQQKITTGPPSRIRLTPITGPNGWRADGSDVVLLDVEVVDSAGRRCPTNQQDITFSVSGPGVWRGGYNSNTPENTRAQTLYTECGINRVAIRSTRTPGAVTVIATASGVTSATNTITSAAVSVVDGLTTELPQVYNAPLGAPEPVPVPPPGSAPSNPGLSATVIAYSSQQAGNEATNVVDQNNATRWAASGAGFPQWVELDMGAVHVINQCSLIPYESRAYQYQVEVKTNLAANYSLALDRTANTNGGAVLTDSFPAVAARYVKLTITGGYQATWATLWEFQVFAQTAPQNSAFFVNFSYTGNGQAVLKTNLQNGAPVFSDRAHTYANLPAYLLGAEYVQTPDGDKTYWAADQLQFLAGTNSNIYVAHDDRVPRPQFLVSAYVDTGDNLLINGAPHSVFKRTVGSYAEVVMQGNYDNNPSTNCNMYAVFAQLAPALPTAAAGPDQGLIDFDYNGSEPATLDGTASVPGIAAITNYVWNEGAAQLATGSNPSVPLGLGTHTITLTVTDAVGATNSDTVVVTVAPFGAASSGTLYGNLADASPIQNTNGTTLSLGSTATDPSFYAGQFNHNARSPVFVFALPNWGSVTNPFATSSLSFFLERRDVNPAAGNVDLYGLIARASATVQATDFWGETAAADPAATFLQNNILIPTSVTNVVYTSADITSYLNPQYGGGTNAGKYVLLRLSTDADFANSQRYFITTADGAVTNNAGSPNLTAWPQINYTAISPYADTDLDGMPDPWEMQNFGTLTNTATVDLDGDGQLNGGEYIAGTDPKSSASRFWVKSLKPETGGGFTVKWDSVGGRTYTVLKSGTVTGGWSPASSALTGTGGELTFTDVNGASTNQYYKIQVTFP